MAHERAGELAQSRDLIDIAQMVTAYYTRKPDVNNPDQAVTFGTSGHRGSSLDSASNEDHILAITPALVDSRATPSTTGEIVMGSDPHAPSARALIRAPEVLIANELEVRVDSHGRYTPTPAISHAILNNPGTDGIVITPSHNPPRDGGFKYNPPTGGPADSDATDWIAQQANDYLQRDLDGV